MMDKYLDNPAWYALCSGNKNFSNGNDKVKFFDREVSPFIAAKENSEEYFQLLFDLIPHNEAVIFISSKQMAFPSIWNIRRLIKGIQMIYESHKIEEEPNADIIPLNNSHIDQMVSLTKLTDPGPFESRTIEFGHYYGIMKQNKLVAMAGQRLHVNDFTEISAVCTHPDFTGKGYAKDLLRHQIHRMQSSSFTPYLHVRSDNHRAINVYESLGFKTRKEIFFYVLQKQ
jgi:ribosomal protein S18 acetylase RimI-like enzyme